MSTDIANSPTQGLGYLGGLHHFMLRYRDLQTLLRPEQLARRLTALDELDAILGGVDLKGHTACSDPHVIVRANALKAQFESANDELFRAARSEISLLGSSQTLRRWLLGTPGERQARDLQPGLGFDLLDEIVNGVLNVREPGEVCLAWSPEMTSYQPTPAHHILELIADANLTCDDVLVDLGSGLGHVPMLTSILTGCRALGVEFQPVYVASAQDAVRNLNLRQVQFVATDARRTDFSMGTVFYLFSPFTGSILRDVLQRLLKESSGRTIRICSLGPCTSIVKKELWLKPRTRPDDERITVFDTQ